MLYTPYVSPIAYCTSGIRMADNALAELLSFVLRLSASFDQIRCLNDDGERKFFTLVKGHHFVDSTNRQTGEVTRGGGAWMEGSIALGRAVCPNLADCASPRDEGARAPTGAEFRYNYMHDNFDGEKLGTFEFSESHHNTYFRNFDNHIIQGMNGAGRELKVHHSLFLSCASGPISYQGDTLIGPNIYRNVSTHTTTSARGHILRSN